MNTAPPVDRRVSFSRQGGREVLQIVDGPIPAPGVERDGALLLRHAAMHAHGDLAG